jgi:thioredoxin 1
VLIVVALAVGIYLVRPAAQSDSEGDLPAVADGALPRLVDLGADKCVPCKMMAPILEELKTEYAGKFTVDFIDVWKNPEASTEYGIKLIPTQVFYAADGTELFRHEGFFGREDILAKWRELGVEL